MLFGSFLVIKLKYLLNNFNQEKNNEMKKTKKKKKIIKIDKILGGEEARKHAAKLAREFPYLFDRKSGN